MRSEYFSHNVLAGNINRWKNITADGLFRKNGTTTIWIWKHWNNLMVNNCSKRNSNWENWSQNFNEKFEFQSVRRSFPRNLTENSEAASFLGQTTSYETEVLEREPWDFYEYFKLLKSYPNKYIYN
jgi:hypothetical protein